MLMLLISCDNRKETGEYIADIIELSDTNAELATTFLPYQLSFNRNKTCFITFSKYSRDIGWLENGRFTVPVEYQRDDHSVFIYDFYTFTKTDTGFMTKILGKEGIFIAMITYEKNHSIEP